MHLQLPTDEGQLKVISLYSGNKSPCCKLPKRTLCYTGGFIRSYKQLAIWTERSLSWEKYLKIAGIYICTLSSSLLFALKWKNEKLDCKNRTNCIPKKKVRPSSILALCIISSLPYFAVYLYCIERVEIF